MKASDWISVEDRLPKTGERVLVMRQIENEVFPDIATYIRRDNYHNGGSPIFYLDDGFDTESVTYWQKIVSPKKRKEMKHTYNEEQKERIAQMLFDFLRKHGCFGGEHFAQDDTSQIDSIDFMCNLADIKDVTEDLYE